MITRPDMVNTISDSSVDYSNSNFNDKTVKGCLFERGCFVDASFQDSTISDTDFSSAYLAGADFTHASIEDVSFGMADLRNAKFTNAKLINVDFSLCDLTGADFTGALFVGINNLDEAFIVPTTGIINFQDLPIKFHGANVKNVSFDNCSFLHN